MPVSISHKLLWSLILSGGLAAAAKPPVIPSGFDAYRQWDKWPYQRIGVRTYMRSTYDRQGNNERADASHFLYQPAPDFNVTLDLQGPGILYFTRYNHWHGSPWHYEVDGTDHIVKETSTADPLHPAPDSVFIPERAFPKPLAYTWADTKGADLSWVPIDFQKSFRMAYSRTFYGTGYYIYQRWAKGTRLSSPTGVWSPEKESPHDVIALLNRAGTDIAPQPNEKGVKQETGQIDLSANGCVALWSHTKGAGTIRALEISVPQQEALSFSRARLKITWDGRSEPSVDAPVAQFYGAGIFYNRDHREYLVRSFPMVVRYTKERVYLSCYFPMPFFRSAKIELAGPEGKAIHGVDWSVRYEPFKGVPSQVGYFHATYHDHPHPELGKDLVLLNTKETEGGGDWSGQLVGTSFIFSHEANLTTLEGDPRFFFDDSQTPQAQGTGTEEWGGGGDYWGGLNMTLPFAGHPAGARSAKEAVSEEDKVESAYRFLLADMMPFGKNALIRLEHGGVNESVQHYETVAFWYGLPAPSLLQTDQLVIGDEASERDHGYVSPDASKPYSITSRYEWGPDTVKGQEIFPATTDLGRKTKTTSEFVLKIDPKNLGVLLRRKLDYSYPNQRAEVSIANADGKKADWKPAGIWYLAGSNTCVFSSPGDHDELGATQHVVETSNRRFRDDEFLLPLELTRGRRAIRVRIRFTPVNIPLYPGYPVPELAWSEMRYTAYSFVTPKFSAPPER